MTINKFLLLLLSVPFVLPAPARAQCRDQLCLNLQNILVSAVTDFRGYRENLTVAPDVSVAGGRVPCQLTSWANNVPMYMCYAQIPMASAQSWYINALASLRTLQPSWQFRVDSPASDHFVDAGPVDCSVPATEGPYIGHCPLHMQVTKQSDGTAKVYLWMSSLSSPYLAARPPGPPAKSAPPASAAPALPVATNACDDLCNGLKNAIEGRLHSFSTLRSRQSNGDGGTVITDKLPGAGDCSIDAALRPRSSSVGTQYVCYWNEATTATADSRFSDLVSRLQVLVPSGWSIKQEDQLEDLSGAKVGAWLAVAPDSKQQIALYISSKSVGLHIQVWN